MPHIVPLHVPHLLSWDLVNVSMIGHLYCGVATTAAEGQCNRWIGYARNCILLRHLVIMEGVTRIIQTITLRVELMVIQFWPMCDRYM